MKLSTRKLYRQLFQQLVVGLVSVAMIVPTPLLMAQTPHIVPDGRTDTTLNINGAVTDVHTGTVRGTTGYNSFERFNVPGGNTTNLYVPGGANSLVNLVHNERTQIDGILNSYKNGQIGGNIFFLNPHGIMIGQSGVVNVGSLHLQTPTQDYMKQLINEHGQISAVHEQMLFEGKVPISPTGLISVKGTINAVEEINLTAREIDLARASRLRAGHQVQVEFGDLVNIDNLNSGNALVTMPDGKIRIVATGDVTATGQVSVDAAPGKNAGQIEIRAGNDINVDGAEITARGNGANSDGGEVVIFADRNSKLQSGAVVDVSATAGKGGFLEFSAKDTVNLDGNGLRSSYGGTVLIDPAVINWTGSGNDVYTKGAEYKLEATSSITLKDLFISTRNISGTGRDAHLNGASQGHSGNIILSAPTIVLTNADILAFATGTYNAGNISLLAEKEVTLTNTRLNAGAKNGKAGDIIIEALNTGGSFDIGVTRSAVITIDKNSVLTGNNILIEAAATAGSVLNLEEIKDSNGNVIGHRIVDDAGNEIDIAALKEKNDSAIKELFGPNNFLKLLGGATTPLALAVRGFVTTTEINIDGTLNADNSIDILATSAGLSSAYDLGIAGFAINVGVVLPTSKITIGPNARLTAVNGDIAIESIVMAEVSQTTLNLIAGGKAPLGVVLGVGVLVTRNNIDVQAGSELTAMRGNIRVAAMTERSVEISASGGAGTDSFAATVAFIYEEADTHVTIGGKMTAVSADIYAITNATKNTIATSTTLGDSFFTGTVNTALSIVPITDILGAFGSFVSTEIASPLLKEGKGIINELISDLTGKTRDLAPSEPKPDKPAEPATNKDGAGVSIAVMVDNNDTSVKIAGTAVITVRDYVDIEALTHNVPVAMASTVIKPVKLSEADTERTEKKNAGAISVPVMVVLQNTTAEIESGAKIYAGNNDADKTEGARHGVIVNALTELPYNLNHPIAKLIANSDEFSITDLTGMLNANFGIDQGLFTTWAQSTVESEETAIALMVSAVVAEVETIARIHDDVTIDGLKSGAHPFGTTYDDKVPNLTVTAYTDIEMGHYAGNIRSFLNSPLPNSAAPGNSTSPPLNYDGVMDLNFKAMGKSYLSRYTTDTQDNVKNAFKDMVQTMWGNQADSGVGAGILYNWFGSTAKAEIGAATLNVNNLRVASQTTGFDVMVGVGASKTDELGITGTLGAFISDIYSYAKIDDSTNVTAAGNVEIDAKDKTIVVGTAGNLVVSEGNAFGLSVIVPIVFRDIRVVWGNYYNDKTETIASQMVTSVVGGNVDIHANALGVTATFVVAGSVTTEDETEKKINSLNDTVKKLTEAVNALPKGASQDQMLAQLQGIQQYASSGGSDSSLGIAGAVAVNLIIENVCAGISGNVSITANSFDIEALNKTIDAAFVGGVVAQLNGSGNNKGVAGAVGVNMIFGNTKAFVDTNKGTLIYTDQFNLKANRGGIIGVFAAGGAGSGSSEGFEAAGSVSVVSIKSGTLTDILYTTVKKTDTSPTGDMIVSATNEALIANFAGGLGIGGNVGFGLAVALSNITMDNKVSIISSPIDARNLTTTAKTESLIVTVALAGGVSHSGNVGIGGTAAISLSDSDTSVTIRESKLTLSGDFVVAALSTTFSGTDNTYNDLLRLLSETEGEDGGYFEDKEKITYDTIDTDGNDSTHEKGIQLGLSARSPRIVTAALAVGGSNEVGFGANIGINLMTEETYVSIANSTITAGRAGIEAKTEGGMIAVGVGIGAAKTLGVGGNLGVNLVGGRTEVGFNYSSLTATNHVNILAENTAGIVNASLTVGAGGTGGAGVGFSYNMVAPSVAVVLNNSEVISKTGDVNLIADNDSDLISILLSIGAGKTGGVGVSLAINTIGTIQLDDADLETPEYVSAELTERERELKSIFNTIGDDDSLGKMLLNTRNRTAIVIETNGNYYPTSIVAGRDVNMNVSSGGGLISISAAVGGGGDFGVSVGAAYNSISGAVGIYGYGYNPDPDITAKRNVNGSSQINNGMYTAVAGGGVGGKAGVALNVAANILNAKNEIYLSRNMNVKADGDIVFKATNSGEVVGSSLALAGGQYAGITATVAINILKGVTQVILRDDNKGYTSLTAGGSITLDAETTNDLYAITGAMELTVNPDINSGSASIGVMLAVNDMSSTASIDIIKSALNAGENVRIQSNVGGDLLVVTGNAAIAASAFGFSAGGNFTYNGVHSTSIINIADTTINAKKDILIDAHTYGEIENYFFLLSFGTMAGINVGAPVNDISSKTKINLDNTELTANQDIRVESLAETRSIGVVVSPALGGTALSAVVDMHLLDSLVETTLRKSNLKADRNITIGSKNSDNTDTVLVGVALGGTTIPINAQGIIATSTVTTNLTGATGTDAANTIIAGNDLDIYAESLLDILEVNAALAVGGNIGVGVAFAINNLEQNTSVNVGEKYNLISGNTLSVRAKGETIMTEHIDALGVSLGSVAIGGAMGLLFADSFTEIVFAGSNVKLQGNAIIVEADDIFTQKTSNIGGFAIGLSVNGIAAAGGLNVLELRNGAVIRGTADMTATDSITVNATVTREIDDLITIAGAIGSLGLVGTINHITIGGAQGSKEGIASTLDILKKANLGNETGTKRTDNLFGDVQGIAGKLDAPLAKKQSAALLLDGNLDAKTITLRANADNNINATATGIGIGLAAAAGGALAYVDVEDNITASFVGNATATGQFTLQGQSANSGHTEAIAGAGAIYAGLAGAGNWTMFTSDITTSLGANSVVKANKATIRSDQNFDDIIAKADAGAIGTVGVGGAGITLRLDGNSIVNINQNVNIYAKEIVLEAIKNFSNSKTDAYGLAGGMLGGAGIDSLLKLGGNVTVMLADGVKLWNSATGFPGLYDDKININAVVNVSEVNSTGDVDAGGIGVAAFGNTDLDMNFDTMIDIRKADLLSGIIQLDAYRKLTGVSALHTTDTLGAIVVAGGTSSVKLAGDNRIRLNGSMLEAWNGLTLTAGKDSTILDAQTRVFNGGIVPVTGGVMVGATTDVAVTNMIDLSGSTLLSVRDITLQTGQEHYLNRAYASTQYIYTGGPASFIGDDEFSLKESTGNVKTNNINAIALNAGNRLEAGIHWNTRIIIDNDGTGVSIQKPDWVTVDVTTGEKSIYDMLKKQIDALNEKLAMRSSFSAVEAAAYEVEIKYLQEQLKYYALNPSGNLTDSSNYAQAKLVQIVGDITATAGDIYLTTGTTSSEAWNSIVAVAGNVLTANDSPQIVILNNSDHFLEISGADLTIPNPLGSGGRILVNGNASEAVGSATLHANRGGDTPLISVKNTAGGLGSTLAPELFLTSVALNNPGGLVELDSKGSIWLANTNLDARDISIFTVGSFYQGYQDGRTDVGGNPFASGSVIAQAIDEWMNSSMFFTSTAEASAQAYKSVLEIFSTAASWNAVFGPGGSGNVGELVASHPDYPPVLAQYMLYYTIANITATAYREALAPYLATYNDAVNQLQAAATTASWNDVFGTSAKYPGDVSKLEAKPGRTLPTSAYEDAKDAYLKQLSAVATNYISSKITNYDNARESGAKIPEGNQGWSSEGYWGWSDEAVSLVDSQNAVTTAITASLPTITGDSIYGKRSVFISAETLNVNGTIHSGSLEYNIDLTTAAVTSAIAAGKTDLTEAVFGIKYDENKNSVAFPQITYSGGTVTIGDVEAMGGNITLFGNIISTGNGKLHVEDGYGNITITAPNTMDIVLGRVDTGLGTEGTITIYDTSKGTNGQPLKTVYTRENGVYKVNGATVSDSNLNYATTADRWLQTTTQTDTTLDWTYTYTHAVAIIAGTHTADWMVKDDKTITGVGGSVTINKTSPVGTFLVSNPEGVDTTSNLWGTYSRTANPSSEYFEWFDHDSNLDLTGLTGNCRHHFDFYASQDFTETFTTYLNASHAIDILFTGNETPGSVNISGARNITLGDLVRAADTVNIAASGDLIGTDKNLITSKEIVLDANNIGTTTTAINLESRQDGTTLTATAKGLVNLASSKNPLLVQSVLGENVVIASTADVLMKTGGTGITARKDLTVSVVTGKITDQTGTGDFLMEVGNNVKLSATGDIRIRHVGNLHVDQIKTGIDGDLYVTVLGSILDSNTVENPDPLSDAEASNLWQSLGLIKGTAEFNENVARRIAAYENEFTQLYFDAWSQAGFAKANYDPNYVFRYSDDQKSILVNSQLTPDQISAEEQKRTAAYHDAFKSAYNANYRYTASDAEKLALIGNAGWTKAQLQNAFNIPMFILTQDAGSRNNTTSLIEEPNFIGRNITLSATGSIGSADGEVVIPIGISSNQFAANDDWRRAVADAEWDDVLFDATEIKIKRYDDIDIAASGWLKTESKDGATYLGSQSDVVVNEIISGTNGTTKGTESLRFKIDGNMIPMIHDQPQTHIYALNAVLEAARGTLGSSLSSPLVLNLTGGNAANGWITARGTNGVYLSFVDAMGGYADAFVREIGSKDGTVSVTAWSIFDAQPELNVVKIAGKNLFLHLMGGSIGTKDAPMLVSQQVGGVSSFAAGGDIFVHNPNGPLNIVYLSAGGDVGTTAYLDLNITDKFTVAGDALLESILGKLSLTDAVFSVAGNATLRAASDIILSGGSVNVGGTWNVAGDEIFVTSVAIVAGNTNLNANGNLIVNGGSAKLGNTRLTSGNNIFLRNWLLSVLGTLDIAAANDLSVTNSTIDAGDTKLTATKGDLNIVGTAVRLDNALLKAGNNVAIVNSSPFDVAGLLSIDAANRLTLNNVTGKIGTAELNASRYSLSNWYLFTEKLLLGGIDIYNDPVFLNSLAADRIVRQSALSFWSNMMRQDEVNSAGLINGRWLPLDEEEEKEEEEKEGEADEDGTLDASDMPEQLGVPVAAHFVPRVSFSRIPDTTESIIALKSFST